MSFIPVSIRELIIQERTRQCNTLCLIASENLPTREIVLAQGSCFMSKYAEGTPGKRFYQGCNVADSMEQHVQQLACKVFDAQYANVQPHSGAQANMIAFDAILEPGDTVLGMELSAGGHLTHGFKANFSGKYFKAIQYKLDQDNIIDYAQIYNLAHKYYPKVIVCGASSYSRMIDFERVRLIADEVSAIVIADIAHVAGLIAGKVMPNPFPHAHIVTTTTHKTLRGPRGGLILTNDELLYKKINKACMPGIQGGPMMHTIAAKGVCFQQALEPEFQRYTNNVVKNMQALCQVFKRAGLSIVTNGSDNHMCVLDLTSLGITGAQAAKKLEEYDIVCNYNAIPSDPRSLTETSGIRLGTPYLTSCGLNEHDMLLLGASIVRILHGQPPHDLTKLKHKVRNAVLQVFPMNEE